MANKVKKYKIYIYFREMVSLWERIEKIKKQKTAFPIKDKIVGVTDRKINNRGKFVYWHKNQRIASKTNTKAWHIIIKVSLFSKIDLVLV
ncbi:hypothetical protein [Amedibacillus sp. YH-ame10]